MLLLEHPIFIRDEMSRYNNSHTWFHVSFFILRLIYRVQIFPNVSKIETDEKNVKNINSCRLKILSFNPLVDRNFHTNHCHISISLSTKNDLFYITVFLLNVMISFKWLLTLTSKKNTVEYHFARIKRKQNVKWQNTVRSLPNEKCF